MHLVARILFASIFLAGAPRHFSGEGIGHAAQAGVALAGVLVPLSGVMALLGALSVILGYRAKWGAWLLVAFLVPVTLWMHAFWTIDDPGLARVQLVMFVKNLSMLGGALFIAQSGAGAWSLDARIAASRSGPGADSLT